MENMKTVRGKNGSVVSTEEDNTARQEENVVTHRRKGIDRIAGWLYRKLLPYPGLRRLCSRINGKLKIVRDPERVIRESIRLSNGRYRINGRNNDTKSASELKVAAVVDEFTYHSFRFECDMIPVEPDNWKSIFSENEIDLFFCESAWVGTDQTRHPWRGRVYGSCNFPKENRTALLDILKYCKEKHIPTIFWNKEDPTHYDDKVHNFVDTAVRFDHIFTTDAGCVERYRKEYGHQSVHCLMFATQPRLFHPITTGERTEEICFAGSWYRQHQERSREMGAILDHILQQGYALKIYDRHSGTSDPNHIFPERFQSYLHPALSYHQMAEAYKESRYALNINTVTDSDTMFARRVFELMSSNTFVISNYSRGMEKLFGDNVLFVDGEKPISLENIEKKRENCLYEVLRHHTYGIRFRQMLLDIGYRYREGRRQVCFFYQVSDRKTARTAAEHFQRENLADKSAVFIVNKDTEAKELQLILEQYQGWGIRVISEHYCRNYEDALQLTGDYFIFADESLPEDFAEKALLHDTYLAGKAGIVKGDSSYTFVKQTGYRNVFYPASMFEAIKQDFYNETTSEQTVYVI